MSDQPTKAYNPRDHLVKLKTRNGEVDYYPACWRLYELNMRYPNANFRSDILHLDPEHNFVIVKCTLYLGRGDLDMAERKTEALKQGLLSALDKVETAAKARCARDLGISTELALDMEDAEHDAAEGQHIVPSADRTSAHALEQSGNGHTTPLQAVQALFASLHTVSADHFPEQWEAFKLRVLGTNVLGEALADDALSAEQLARLHGTLVGQQKRAAEQAAAATPVVRTAESVKAFYAKTYKIKAADCERNWQTFTKGVLGQSVPDDRLTPEHLTKLNYAISQQYQRTHSPKMEAAS
ncbi:MAG: hypothetical protein JO202_08215 [Ktedonobacteraceae bacterium]|nr:hypothetical protein [Ktedonobacteraceae bacterium]